MGWGCYVSFKHVLIHPFTVTDIINASHINTHKEMVLQPGWLSHSEFLASWMFWIYVFQTLLLGTRTHQVLYDLCFARSDVKTTQKMEIPSISDLRQDHLAPFCWLVGCYWEGCICGILHHLQGRRCSMFLRNTGTHLSRYVMAHSRRLHSCVLTEMCLLHEDLFNNIISSYETSDLYWISDLKCEWSAWNSWHNR
jgi:hypothetical protein